MKKKILGIILVVMLMMSLTACGVDKGSNVIDIDNVLNSPDTSLVNFEVVENNWYEAILVDKNTGVMYVWLTTNCGGITPLYNADGTLKLYEE